MRAQGTLEVFKPFFESTSHLKVRVRGAGVTTLQRRKSPSRSPQLWHNYGFDRHVLYNEGIDVAGLGGDTMHMARLWTTARAKKGGYSLESLSADLLGHRKAPMKERFSVPKLKKDGSEGKERVLPPVEELQRNPATRLDWIDYSTFDAEATWRVGEVLQSNLKQRHWVGNRSMWDFYKLYYIPFATVLTDMERAGIQVDVQSLLPAAEKQALAERKAAEEAFLDWACQYCPDAYRMNPGSDAQKAHFLFAPAKRVASTRRKAAPIALSPPSPPRRVAPRPSQAGLTLEEFGAKYNLSMCEDPEVEGAAMGATVPEALAPDATEWPGRRKFRVDNTEEWIEPGKKKAKKQRNILLDGLGVPPPARTAAGWPAVSATVLSELAGAPFADPPKLGSLAHHFGSEEEGREACEAVANLHQVGLIDTMLSNFILPLQSMTDSQGRVHCSMNLNTDTGRLSARRPNLQNQPALEKDRYRIRQAFGCKPGNKLIVADYGQLELRLLAHMADCKSMIEAFKLGGDFHSRTAMGMYDHISQAVASGDVLLEWDGSEGEAPPAPLLKNEFPSERRQAKILNFSIAYGKTAVGLSKDFGVSVEEAQATVDRWYADRPEVREWQAKVLEIARAEGATRTLMGRYRDLPDLSSSNWGARGHAERAAINTPIQGGAADVVMMAMLKLAADEQLKAWGWTMLLQIHDEVILEGPEESADAALQRVVQIMEQPFSEPLKVDMIVDASIADTWYEGK